MNGSTATAIEAAGFPPPESLSQKAQIQWVRVVPISRLSPWQVDALKMVFKLASLPENWDTYGSRPPTRIAVETAIGVITQVDLEELPAPYVVPVPGGGIQLEWVADDRELELEVLPEGGIAYLKAKGDESPIEGELPLTAHSELTSLLAWLR